MSLDKINTLHINEEIDAVRSVEWAPENSDVKHAHQADAKHRLASIAEPSDAPGMPTGVPQDIQEALDSQDREVLRELKEAKRQAIINKAGLMLKKIAVVESELDQASSFSADISNNQELMRACRKVFGGKHTEITKQMYREALRTRNILQQEGVESKIKLKRKP